MLKELHGKLNYTRKIRLNGCAFVVPVIGNMGLSNLELKDNWFSKLLRRIQIPAGSNVLDVGMNVGQSLLTFRSICKNGYWGFEPNPSCVHYLKILTEKNRFADTHIIPVGLSSENRLAKFFLKSASDQAGTVEDKLRPGYYESGETTFVPLFAFDELGIEKPKNISLVKIDVEGAELGVLKGMAKMVGEHKPVIICEVLDYHSEASKHQMQAKASELSTLVKSWGYRLMQIFAEGENIRLEEINEINLRQWNSESWNRNDYLLLPEGRKTP